MPYGGPPSPDSVAADAERIIMPRLGIAHLAGADQPSYTRMMKLFGNCYRIRIGKETLHIYKEEVMLGTALISKTVDGTDQDTLQLPCSNSSFVPRGSLRHML